MKIVSLNGETKSASGVFILLLAVSAVLAVLPAAFAKTYTKVPDRDTGTAVGVSPRLLGLGQQCLINILTYPAPSGPKYYAQDIAGSLTGGFQNITCTITMPDGTKSTFMPIDDALKNAGAEIPGQAENVGSLQFYYTPTQVGNYSVTASFPGQTYTTDSTYANLNLSVYYKPSSSVNTATFTVQEDLVLSGLLNGYPWSSLPTSYWTYPVSTDNREWAAISGSWAQAGYNILGGNYNPYSTAPTSPHIVWATQVGSAGLAGGAFGSKAYGSFAPGWGMGQTVLDGKIYQNEVGTGKFDCIDIRTGQLLWSAPGTINGAQRLLLTGSGFQTAAQTNEGGVSEFLWGGISPMFTYVGIGSPTWTQYSPFNGAVLRTIVGVPQDLMEVKYEDGDSTFWCMQGNNAKWNTTVPLGIAYCNLIKWDLNKVSTVPGIFGTPANSWSTGIVWNVSIMQPGQISQLGDSNWRSPDVFPFTGANSVVIRMPNDMQIMEGFDATTGRLLWINNATVLDLDVAIKAVASSTNGPIIVQDGASGKWVAYSVTTGQEIWRAPAGEAPWGFLPAFEFIHNNGVTYFGSYDGHIYGYDVKTGDLVWKSDYVGASDETIYGNQPFNSAFSGFTSMDFVVGAVGADGILYFASDNTYALIPASRFHVLVAVNESTGHFLWTLPIGANPTAITYGYLLGTDFDNGIQYCIGKGKTATTVTAPLTTVTAKTGVLIQGTVMDMSPGNPDTPAVSEADMSMWMDYLYGQNATLLNSPPTTHGVEVELRALGSDGTLIDLGTETTNSYGQFSKVWTPTTAGKYTVYAAFAGGDSYWSSSAATALSVGPAPETPSQQPAAAVPDNTMTIVSTGIAVIIAVAIATVLLLRKGKQ